MTQSPFYANGTCAQTRAPRRLLKCATTTALVSPSRQIVRRRSTSVLNALTKFIGLYFHATSYLRAKRPTRTYVLPISKKGRRKQVSYGMIFIVFPFISEWLHTPRSHDQISGFGGYLQTAKEGRHSNRGRGACLM